MEKEAQTVKGELGSVKVKDRFLKKNQRLHAHRVFIPMDQRDTQQSHLSLLAFAHTENKKKQVHKSSQFWEISKY